MKRRSFCIWAPAALIPGLHAHAADAYPVRPVRIICPYAAGGGPDVMMRQLAPALGDALGQPVVIENKVGAAGVLAAQFVASQPPDGYTVLQGSSTHLVQKIITPGVKFDPLADFVPICNVSSSPSVLVVPATAPYKSVDDLIKAAKADPGRMNYSSGGIGTGAHLAGATLAALAGLNVTHIPLKGSVEIAGSLLRGDTQFAFPTAGTGVPQVQGGKLRALAVTSAKRMTQLPDVPTLEEILKNRLTVQDSWSGIWAPARTQQNVIDTLFKAITTTLRVPSVRAGFEKGGSEVMTSTSPREFAAFMQSENTKWAEIVRMTGLANS